MAEIELADVFVEMADTLVDDFDMIDFLHVLTERCVQLLGCLRSRDSAHRRAGCPAGGGRVLGADPAVGAVPVADRPGSVPGLLPHRHTGIGGRPAVRRSVATIRRRRRARSGSAPFTRCRCGCAATSSAR